MNLLTSASVLAPFVCSEQGVPLFSPYPLPSPGKSSLPEPSGMHGPLGVRPERPSETGDCRLSAQGETWFPTSVHSVVLGPEIVGCM